MRITIPRDVKLFRILGSNLTLLGISVVISYFVSLYLEDNWTSYYSLFKDINKFDIAWIVGGLYIILLGVSLLAQLGNEGDLRDMETAKIPIPFILKQIPFSIVFFTVVMYIINPILVENPRWISENFYKVTFMNALVIYIALAISMNLLFNSLTIFKNSIPNSKDRLTIIVTIFATIISAIALFK